MSNNTQKMKEIISSEDHVTSYSIVNICKNMTVSDNKDFQNFNEADLPG